MIFGTSSMHTKKRNRPGLRSLFPFSARLTAVVLLLLLLVHPFRSWGAPSEMITPRLAHETRHFANGLTLVMTRMPATEMVSVYAYVRNGSTCEGDLSGSGLSHFLEHMIFKGTVRRGPGVISREVLELGGTINASTGLDHTLFTITVPGQASAQAIDLLADMLQHAAFDPAEFERERDVVLSEIQMLDDNPDWRLSRLSFETVYTRHPYRIPVIGYEPLLKTLSVDEMRGFYHRVYSPENIVISVAGSFDPDRVAREVEAAFAEAERTRIRPLTRLQEPRQLSPRYRRETDKSPITRIAVLFPSVSLFDPDMVALDALAMILGQGASSRLHRVMVQREQIVESVSASNFTPQDPGIFEITASFQSGDPDDVVRRVCDEIRRLQTRGVTAAELRKIQKRARREFWQNQQDSSQVADDTAVFQGMIGDPGFALRYARAFQGLGPEDIVRVAREYLQPEQMSVVVLAPETEVSEAEAESVLALSGEPQRFKLSNGIRLVVRPNHATPDVAVVFVVNAGTGQETREKNGISEFMADVWTKGSRRFSAEDIQDLAEEKAVGLSGFAGRNSIGLEAGCLVEDLGLALDLLAEVALRPTFPGEEIEKTRTRFLAAIAARDDDISQAAGRHTLELLFGDHPLGRTALGMNETVAAITREDIQRYYETFLRAGNAVITVFGDVDPGEVVRMLEARFRDMPTGDVELIATPPEPRDGSLTRVLEFHKKQAAVNLAARAVGIYHADRFGLEVLSAILGAPFRGEIFRVIRDEMGASYRLGGGYLPAREAGYLNFQVMTSPERSEEVARTLRDLVRGLRERPVDEATLEGIKAFLIGKFQRTTESNQGFGFISALDELYGLGYDAYRGYETRIRAVTARDIQRLAETYLRDEQLVTVTLRPGEGESPEPDVYNAEKK